MTQVIFDVVDLVGEVHPGDTVSVWPPYVASTVDGRVRSTRKIDVLVDEGPVTREVEPGPLVVQLQCRGIVDTKPRTVTIPDEGTITLANLLQSTFTYTPAVVSQVSLDAQRAEDAAVRAEGVADDFGSLEGVEDLVQVASDSALSASGSESSASSSASAAASSASAAATSEVNAGESENVALDASAAAIAAAVSVAQFQGQGFPEGVVTAPVGSIYTDTAATAGAIRWIKTSGTGNTGWKVEHGDTGWRDVTTLNTSSSITLGAGAKILIRRINNDILFKVIGPITPADTRASLFQLITGWQPDTDTWVALGGSGEQARHSTFWVNLENLTVGRDIIGTGWAKEARWSARDEWPPTLPGVPA